MTPQPRRIAARAGRAPGWRALLLLALAWASGTVHAGKAASTEIPPPDASTAAAPATPAAALAEHERLVAPVPPDWAVSGRANDGELRTLEYAPHPTLPRAGDERILVESSRPEPLPDPRQFLRMLARDAHRRCPSLRASELSHRDENGYATSVWLFDCPDGPDTGLPLQMFKAIRGDDWFYVVARTSTRADTRPAGVEGERVRVAEWAQYMRDVKVCNAAQPGHPCPGTGAPRTTPATGAGVSPAPPGSPGD
jgi:hypothetical protein